MGISHNPLHTVASNENLGPVFIGIDWAVFCLSTIVVLVRLYTRLWITNNIGWGMLFPFRTLHRRRQLHDIVHSLEDLTFAHGGIAHVTSMSLASKKGNTDLCLHRRRNDGFDSGTTTLRNSHLVLITMKGRHSCGQRLCSH